MTDDIDDVIIEDSTEDGDTGTPEQKLKQLRDKLRKVETEAGDYLAGWQRAKADYVNLQKRSRDDLAQLSDVAVVRVLEELIPVFDSLEASAHESVLKQLDTILSKLGVSRARPATGSVFDPAIGEAVSTVATEDISKDNTVHSVLQSGYVRGGIVIRPARLTVYQHG